MPTVPDTWGGSLTATTDAQGVATLDCLSGIMMPMMVQVTGPGVAPHTLPLDVPRGRDAVLKLGRPGRVVGIVRTESGESLADIPVELWVQGADIRESPFGEGLGTRRITADEVLRLDPHPLRTGPHGAFQTPSTLLSGSTYRVSIRHDGFVPFVSDWVTLSGERAAIPSIRLQPLAKLSGKIQDRQGPQSPAPSLPAGWRSRNGDRCSGAICTGRHQPWKGRHPGRAARIPAPGLVGRSVIPGRNGITDPGASERTPGAGHEAAGRSDPTRRGRAS